MSPPIGVNGGTPGNRILSSSSSGKRTHQLYESSILLDNYILLISKIQPANYKYMLITKLTSDKRAISETMKARFS